MTGIQWLPVFGKMEIDEAGSCLYYAVFTPRLVVLFRFPPKIAENHFKIRACSNYWQFSENPYRSEIVGNLYASDVAVAIKP